jgi:hypothetical protein
MRTVAYCVILVFPFRLAPCALRLKLTTGRQIIPHSHPPKTQGQEEEDNAYTKCKQDKLQGYRLQKGLSRYLGDQYKGKEVHKNDLPESFENVEWITPNLEQVVKDPAYSVGLGSPERNRGDQKNDGEKKN